MTSKPSLVQKKPSSNNLNTACLNTYSLSLETQVDSMHSQVLQNVRVNLGIFI